MLNLKPVREVLSGVGFLADFIMMRLCGVRSLEPQAYEIKTNEAGTYALLYWTKPRVNGEARGCKFTEEDLREWVEKPRHPLEKPPTVTRAALEELRKKKLEL